MRATITIPTLVGPLSLVWDDDALGVDADGRVCHGAVVASSFSSAHRFASRGAQRVGPNSATGDLAKVVAAVRAWNDGSLIDALDEIGRAHV